MRQSLLAAVQSQGVDGSCTASVIHPVTKRHFWSTGAGCETGASLISTVSLGSGCVQQVGDWHRWVWEAWPGCQTPSRPWVAAYCIAALCRLHFEPMVHDPHTRQQHVKDAPASLHIPLVLGTLILLEMLNLRMLSRYQVLLSPHEHHTHMLTW